MILVTGTADGDRIVTVLPITHSLPEDSRLAVELPAMTKARLKLDSDRSWVVLTEANRFIWPGPDLRPAIAGDAASLVYGLLPHGLIDDIRHKLVALLKGRQTRVVARME